MILGICSIVLCNSFLVSVTCGILAIVFGIKCSDTESKMAKAGLITGIIGLSLKVILILFGFVLGATFFGALSTMLF